MELGIPLSSLFQTHLFVKVPSQHPVTVTIVLLLIITSCV